MRGLLSAGLGGLVAALAPMRGAVAQNEFVWKGRMAPGQSLEIRGVNGDVRAEAGSGEAVVSAVKKARRSDPDDVRIEVVEHADGVTICAVYPGDGRRNTGCAPGRSGHPNVRNNDVRVHFTVKVPAGVTLIGTTVNGEVEAAYLASDVEARTVNGGIRIATAGHVEARTVNGSIVASMGRGDWLEGLELTTVNGSITLNLPWNVSTEVRASTVNGDILSDFPLTVSGRLGRRRIMGTIGGGGRTLAVSTVNGTIRLLSSAQRREGGGGGAKPSRAT